MAKLKVPRNPRAPLRPASPARQSGGSSCASRVTRGGLRGASGPQKAAATQLRLSRPTLMASLMMAQRSKAQPKIIFSPGQLGSGAVPELFTAENARNPDQTVGIGASLASGRQWRSLKALRAQGK